MKLKQKAVVFPSKRRATQRRNSLQRIKDEVLRRNVRILLSPLPDHNSPFRISRKSITNLSLNKGITLVNRRSILNEGKNANEQNQKSPYQALITKSPRKRRRKNEAEKLQEELHSKKCINDENIFRSRRVLRSRLILTPKSPLVRVKKIVRRSMKSRKLSSTSLNQFLSREVVIELEKLPTNDKSLEKEASRDLSVEEPQPETEQDVNASGVRIPAPLEFTIVLEKLPVEPEKANQVPDEFAQRSEENSSQLKSPSNNNARSSRVLDDSKSVPLRDIRILLEKLPDKDFPSITETSRSTETDVERILESGKKQSDETDSTSEDDRSTNERRKKATTPSKTATKEMVSPVTPAAVPKSLSTPVSAPIHEMTGSAETNSKKTPKSLNIPLRRVTVIKSKFSKMNPALKSPVVPSPIKVRPTSTYLFSPKTKSHTSNINQTETKIRWSDSNIASSISTIISPISDEKSTTPEVTKTASPPSHIWKGTIVMPEIAKCSVVLKKVSGDCEGLSEDVHSSKSNVIDRLDCVGRIHPNTVWDYLNKIKKIGRKDILVLRFEPTETQDELHYRRLYSFLNAKSRLAVVGNTGQAIKDFYIVPLASNSSLPEVLLPLNGPGFEDSRPDVLLAVVVRSRRGQNQNLQLTHPHNIRPSQHYRIGSILETHKRTELQSERTPPTSQSTPLCTEVVSPLSRGQLLTQKSLASSPNPRQVLFIKSTRKVRSPKHHANDDSNEKMLAKSPMNRGRLLMEQSLAASPKSGKEIRSSASGGSTLNRSHSNLSFGRKEQNDISHKLKWSSAGDLLKEKDQQMDVESDPNKDTSPIATPLDVSPTTRVFSNGKTCAAILSTLRISDRNKSTSTPDVKKPPNVNVKSVSISQPDLLQKLSEEKIDSTKLSIPKKVNLKNSFHIPKVKPGFSTSTKISTTITSSLPRSGFTPSPPAKSTLTQSVLNLGTYIPSSHPASTYSRKLPTKPLHKPPLTNPTSASNIQPLTAKTVYSCGSQSSTIKPMHSSSSQDSTLSKNSSLPPYTSTPIPLPIEPPQSSSSHIFAKPFPVHIKDPRLAKSLPTHSQTTSNRSLQTPQSKSASPKPQIVAKRKPQHTITPGSRSSHKSKSGGLKVAYMGSRSSNNASFSKYLPSGPQYSPTYSKYLQNGFSRLPDANVPSKPKTPRPPSPGTSSILRWSTVKPWMGTKPASPSKASSTSFMSKSDKIPAGPTTSVPVAEAVKPPTGPSGSLTSSVLTSNPEYSPLCPQFDF